jgi:hypothetical protein
MSKGSWSQTVQGIRNLLKLKTRVELRIIVNKLNHSSLSETASFIARNLSDVERVVFINMKYTGNAFRNRRRIFVRYSEAVSGVTGAVNILRRAGIEVRLFHFPLCTLPDRYRDMARGVTKHKGELSFTEACKECRFRGDCPMVWKSYLVLAGDGEFRALK